MTDLSFPADALPADKITAVCAHLGITMTATFLPFSQSRHSKPDASRDAPWPSLNWRITIERNGAAVLETEYAQGIGHAPAYKGSVARFGAQNSRLRQIALDMEMEQGRVARPSTFGRDSFSAGAAIPTPPLDAVVWSLVQDAAVIDYPTFETWAEEYGYSPDSRRAETLYRECLELALKLRAAIGDAGLELLRDAGEDY